MKTKLVLDGFRGQSKNGEEGVGGLVPPPQKKPTTLKFFFFTALELTRADQVSVKVDDDDTFQFDSIGIDPFLSKRRDVIFLVVVEMSVTTTKR